MKKVLIPVDKKIESKSTEKLLYSIEEAAEKLSYSRQTVYELVKCGRILAINPLGGDRGKKIPHSELSRFVETEIKNARADRASKGAVA